MRLENLLKLILLLTSSLGLYDAQTSYHRIQANRISNKEISIIAGATSRGSPENNFKTLSTSAALTPSFPSATTANAIGQAASLLGPDPYVDIRSTGAYTTFSSTKVNTNGTSTVRLAVASHFKNGEYVTIFNAGTACTLSTPSAPTAMPSANAGGAFNTVSGPPGSNSNAYKIVAVSTTGCYSVASPSGSTSTASTLGLVGSNISSISAVGSVATVTTTSAHSFVAGQMVYVQYNSLSSGQFEGWFTVLSVPDSTHFTYFFPADTRVSAPSTATVAAAPLTCAVTNTVLTRNIATVTCSNSFEAQNIPIAVSGTTNGGGIFNGSWQATSVSSTKFSFYLSHANVNSAEDSGTAIIPNVWGFNVNHLSWPAVTNAFKYFIYGRDGGNFNLIGQTMFNSWNDYGFNMESGQTFPAWAPTTAPGASGNNHLTAQITSGGGTTTLGLSVAAGATLSSAAINSDDGPALIAALNTAKGQQHYCAPVLIHNSTGTGTFGISISSFTDTTTTNCSAGTILVQGQVNLNDTIKVFGLSIKGTGGNTGIGSFGQLSNGALIQVSAFPGFWSPSNGSGVNFTNVTIGSFGSNGTNGNLQFLNQGIFSTFEYVNWVHQSPGPLSISQIIDNPSTGFTYKFNHNNIDGGYYANTSGGQYFGLAPYGSMVITGFGQGSASSGLLQVEHTWFENKGGFDIEQTNGQGGSTYLIKDVSTESHAYPTFAFSGPALSQVSIINTLDIDGAFIADTPAPLVTVFANAFLTNASLRTGGGGTQGHPWNTGTPLVGVSQTSVNQGAQQLFGEENFGSNSILDGQFNTTQPGPMGVKRFTELITIPSMFSLTSTVPGPATAPTCSVGSGGSIPTGAWQFIYVPVWWNNAEGTPSGFSSNCTTTTGNQTITVNWTLVPSVKGYNVYRCQGFTNCFAVRTLPSPMYPGTTTSAVLTSFAGSTSPSTVAAGGPTTVSGAFIATQSLQLGAANSGGTLTVNVPSLTANRTVTLPDASGAVVLSAGTLTNGNLIKSDANGTNVDSGIAASGVLTLSGAICTNGELALSAGWGTSATVTAVAGIGLACEWTLTSRGTGQTASPTITDTLLAALPSATILCTMQMVGGTGTATLIDQTTLSATAPVFTFGGTPVAAATYKVVRRCGP